MYLPYYDNLHEHQEHQIWPLYIIWIASFLCFQTQVFQSIVIQISCTFRLFLQCLWSCRFFYCSLLFFWTASILSFPRKSMEKNAKQVSVWAWLANGDAGVGPALLAGRGITTRTSRSHVQSRLHAHLICVLSKKRETARSLEKEERAIKKPQDHRHFAKKSKCTWYLNNNTLYIPSLLFMWKTCVCKQN